MGYLTLVMRRKGEGADQSGVKGPAGGDWKPPFFFTEFLAITACWGWLETSLSGKARVQESE